MINIIAYNAAVVLSKDEQVQDLHVKQVNPAHLLKAGNFPLRLLVDSSGLKTYGKGKDAQQRYVLGRDISISEHCANVVELIRLCHEMDIDGEQQWQREQQAWAYIEMSSIKKLLARFERGMNTTGAVEHKTSDYNIFEALTYTFMDNDYKTW